MSRSFKLSVPDGEVTGVEDGGGSTRIVLTHGASGNLHTPALKLLSEALAARGLGAVRFNLPAAEAGKRSPDRAPVAEAAWQEVMSQMRQGCDRLIVGGRSFGGRMASHVAARDRGACDGLLLLAYPLHPPGKPERLRTAHLPDIQVPMLVVQGDRDPFASGSLLEETFDPLPMATIMKLEGGDHSHKVKGRPPGEVAAQVADEVVAWLGGASF